MLSEYDVGLTAGAEHAVADHAPRPIADLFARLEHHEHGARPPGTARGEQVDGTGEPGRVHVVPARCITGTSPPSASGARTVLSVSPVFSSTGSASMSARSITVGPVPFRSTPVRPRPVCTS
jgi:hypothetical protein